MKVLVCGGRGYRNEQEAFKALDILYSSENGPITLVIQGGAPGADSLAHKWADKNGIPNKTFPAKWNDFSEPCIIGQGQYGKYNKLAGSKRNKQMLDEGQPDMVFAFPGGSGTADMVKQAKKSNVRVMEFLKLGGVT